MMDMMVTARLDNKKWQTANTNKYYKYKVEKLETGWKYKADDGGGAN